MSETPRLLLFEISRQEFTTPVRDNDCVALVIRDIHGRVLIVQENEENHDHGRSSGTWGIPTETCASDDKTFINAAYALLAEEITGRLTMFSFAQGSYRYRSESYKNKPERLYGLHTALVFCEGDVSTLPLNSMESGEISNYRWVAFEQLQEMSDFPFEPEALRLIESYQREGFLSPI